MHATPAQVILAYRNVGARVCRLVWFAACALVTVTTSAAERLQLSDYHAVWRFEQSGRELGNGWRAPEFDDAKWASGPGVFAWPASVDLVGHARVGTVLRSEPSGLLPVLLVTHYFRTTFRWDDDPGGVFLSGTNIVDDGAV